ncbi:hypothetical protein HOD20_01885 [archaeon]|jgi:hypothetical protein|nr:hypothetical protein [archaeon]MBT4351256.1 hypothetical protein [archaeon]MBT4648142.1 hypothetical protein [archaeon]MBT6822440.1 hypothetical protein [archaeon]MBT7391909.1 hypothetical protein [archaeon]
MYLHFIASILMIILLSLMSLNNSLKTRMIYIVPIIVLYYTTFMLFSFDYDKKMIERWKVKEDKLKNTLNVESIEKYLKDKYKLNKQN